jgi:hypothetical protein
MLLAGGSLNGPSREILTMRRPMMTVIIHVPSATKANVAMTYQ